MSKPPPEPSAAVRRIPVRSEIPEADRWDLTHLYPDDAAWEAAFAELQKHYPGVEQFRGKMAESPAPLLAALEFEKSIDQPLERLSTYASLRVSENAADPSFLEREARLQNLQTDIVERCSFMGPELMAVPDGEFHALASSPELAGWRTVLERLRRFKPHTLNEREERLLAMSSQPLAGHEETFSQLTNVDLKFGVITDSTGTPAELSLGSFSSFLVKPDRDLRRRAFHQFYAEFSDHKFTLASTLASSVRTDVFQAKARNHPSALAAALHRNNIPQTVYSNLVGTVRANLAPLYRYYQLRRRALGIDSIHHYDTYVPLVEQVATHLTFDEAIDRVIAAVHPLGGEYTRELEAGLRGRWCDRYESKGKRSGAFSSGCYGSPPYILMNYKPDVFADMFTLAHEAGHSMHTWYAQRNQTFQDHHYPIFLAEVASTFNEELLTHHLLGQTDDPSMRAHLLNRQIDDLRGTIYRQTMFAEFEKIIHERQEAGEALTLETITAVYRDLLAVYFGPDFTLDPELDLECLRIPHFYSAFYVYQYATGMSAAMALARQVLETGDANRYLGFLKSGGKQFPIDTLREAGVDMTSPAPVESALELFAKCVDELASLLGIDLDAPRTP
ncbi:MAG: oligoendopeptidase F [Chthoniobacterales bacterium]|nr:oligoendopeptidase F [Chthoniobacterales bacterium]